MSEEERKQCSICFGSIDDFLATLNNCTHTFHEACIIRWGEERGTCPMCRSPFDLIRIARTQLGETVEYTEEVEDISLSCDTCHFEMEIVFFARNKIVARCYRCRIQIQMEAFRPNARQNNRSEEQPNSLQNETTGERLITSERVALAVTQPVVNTALGVQNFNLQALNSTTENEGDQWRISIQTSRIVDEPERQNVPCVQPNAHVFYIPSFNTLYPLNGPDNVVFVQPEHSMNHHQPINVYEPLVHPNFQVDNQMIPNLPNHNYETSMNRVAQVNNWPNYNRQVQNFEPIVNPNVQVNNRRSSRRQPHINEHFPAPGLVTNHNYQVVYEPFVVQNVQVVNHNYVDQNVHFAHQTFMPDQFHQANGYDPLVNQNFQAINPAFPAQDATFVPLGFPMDQNLQPNIYEPVIYQPVQVVNHMVPAQNVYFAQQGFTTDQNHQTNAYHTLPNPGFPANNHFFANQNSPFVQPGFHINEFIIGPNPHIINYPIFQQHVLIPSMNPGNIYYPSTNMVVPMNSYMMNPPPFYNHVRAPNMVYGHEPFANPVRRNRNFYNERSHNFPRYSQTSQRNRQPNAEVAAPSVEPLPAPVEQQEHD